MNLSPSKSGINCRSEGSKVNAWAIYSIYNRVISNDI